MSSCQQCGGVLTSGHDVCTDCETFLEDTGELFLEDEPEVEAEETASQTRPAVSVSVSASGDSGDYVAPTTGEIRSLLDANPLFADAGVAPTSESVAEDEDVPVIVPAPHTNRKIDLTTSAEEEAEFLSTASQATRLDVRIAADFEIYSAPREESPTVHALIDLEPAGPSLVDPADGPVAHVVLALDLSASMDHADKYPMLIQAIDAMLRDLRNSASGGDVLISIVLFAYGAEVALKAQLASELDPSKVLGLIHSSKLRFTRYTDMRGALSRAGRIAYDSHRTNKRLPIRIYVMTDGQPQDMAGAKQKMATISRLPVDVHALAFGDDANVAELQKLFSGGRGGTVKHVRKETLTEAFGRIAEVAKSVVAKRALVDVELCAGVVGGSAYRYRPGRFAYGKNAFKAGRRFSTDLGVLESGRRYSLLVQFKLPPTVQRETEIGRVTVRVPGEGGAQTFEALLSISRHAGSQMPQKTASVKEALTVLEGTNVEDAGKVLRSLEARRRIYVDERRDPYLIALIDRAIEEVKAQGSLDSLSHGERAALMAHTATVAVGPAFPSRSDFEQPNDVEAGVAVELETE